MQPSRSRVACYVPSFIGFAHLLRRDVFIALGGYREVVRVLRRGERILPAADRGGLSNRVSADALVMHEPDPAAAASNATCATSPGTTVYALYNEPLHRARLAAAGAACALLPDAARVEDRRSWGWAWILRELGGTPDPCTAIEDAGRSRAETVGDVEAPSEGAGGAAYPRSCEVRVGPVSLSKRRARTLDRLSDRRATRTWSPPIGGLRTRWRCRDGDAGR